MTQTNTYINYYLKKQKRGDVWILNILSLNYFIIQNLYHTFILKYNKEKKYFTMIKMFRYGILKFSDLRSAIFWFLFGAILYITLWLEYVFL